MNERHWCIAWSANVTPELSMIPDRGVFLRAAQGRSLTATVEGMFSDIWSGDAIATLEAITVDVDVVEMDEVEELCCCSTLTLEPKQASREWLDQALFV